MPVYNCEKFLSRAIESILSQSYKDFELLIGDDCSSDDSVKIMHGYANDQRVKIILSDTNTQKIGIFNELLKLATGKYVALQDADDWSAIDRLEKQVDFLENNPSYIACGSQAIKVDEAGKYLYTTKDPISYDDILSNLDKSKAIATPATYMFSNEFLQSIGGYRPYFRGICGEDEDLLLRMVQHKICNLPDPLYFYRQTSSSLSLQYSNDPKRYLAFSFARELYSQRLKDGKDWIDMNDKASIEEFFSFHGDVSLIYERKQIMNLLLIKKYDLAVKKFGMIFRSNPFRGWNYVFLVAFVFMKLSPVHPIDVKNFLQRFIK